MITIKRTFCPGRGMIRPEELTGYVFSPEAAAHMFIITKMEKVDGQEAAVPFTAGTDISCRFIKANGVTELVDGDLTDDGAASITLPAECYQVPGRFILSIYAETSEETICIYSATATALAGDTEEINVSGNTKRTIDAQIAALNEAVENAQETVEQVQEVIDSIPQDYTALSNSVSDLKSAVDIVNNVPDYVPLDYSIDATQKYISSTGTTGNNDAYSITNYIDCEGYDKIYYKKGAVTASSVCYTATYDKDKVKKRTFRWTGNAETRGYESGLAHFTLETGEKYVRFTVFSDTVTYGAFEAYGNGYPLVNRFNDIPYNACMSMYDTFGVCGASWDCGYFKVSSTSYRVPELAWGKNVAKRNGNTCLIFAYPGLNTASWLTDEHGLPLLLNTQAQDLYILTFGGNDSSLGANWLGSLTDITSHETYSEYGDSFFGNYGKIIEQIKAYAPNAKIILAMNYNSIYQSQNRGNFFNAVVEIATHYGLPYINWSDDTWYSSDFVRNGLVGEHPTPVIYSGIAQSWERLYSKCVNNFYDYFKDYGA